MYYQPHRKAALRTHAGNRHGGRNNNIRIVAVLLATAFIFIFTNAQLQKLIEKTAETQIATIYTKAVSEAVGELMEQSSNLCSEVIALDRGDNGNVTALRTNTAALNLLKAELSDKIAQRLKQLESEEIYVPLGTLTGIAAFSGCGPDIRVRLKLVGGVSTDMHSSFIDAGVNQTLHTIGCNVDAEFFIMIAGSKSKVKFTSDTILAQSIIVGAVPDSYTVVNGDTSDTVGQIFDYGNPYGE